MPAGAPLERLLRPRGVAFVGASPDVERYNGRTLQYCVREGFAGGVYPVNPKHARVFDLECFPDLASIPGPVDVVVVLVGSAQIPALFEQCRAKQVAFAVVVGDLATKGAAEHAVLQGLRERIVDGGPRVVGPVCVGVISPHVRLAMTMSSGMLAGRPPSGGIGLVSQSGGVLSSVLDRAHEFGAGFSALISSGSEFDLTLCDYVDYLVDDAATRCIAIYAEKIIDAPRLFAIAERARARRKPILMLKSGTSERGASTAATHSGAIASDRDIEAAAMRRHGIVCVDDLDDLHMTAELLCRAADAPTGGVAAVSQSGGYCTIVADALSAAGVPLALPTPETVRRIHAQTPVTHVANPLDSASGPPGNNAPHTKAALLAFQDDPGVGVTLYAETMYMYQAQGYALQQDVVRHGRKPHVVCWQGGSATRPVIEGLRRSGVLTFDSLRAATAGLSALYRYRMLVERSAVRECDTPAAMQAAVPAAGGLLDDARARALLAAYGVPLVTQRLARTPREAADAAAAIGFPVVVKGLMAGVAHKTELGLVALGLDSAEAVIAACERMGNRVGRQLQTYSVQPLVRGGVELVVGVKSDVNLGPALVLGLGGLFVEAYGAPAIEMAPLDRADAASMIAAVDRRGILAGYRTGRALASDALAATLLAVGRMAWHLRERIDSVDLNPVVVTEHGAVAVDAVVALRPAFSGTSAIGLASHEEAH